MADQPKPLDVCTDTCVLINLARVSRLDLLGQIQDMLFHAPQEVLNEVSDPAQTTKVEEAIGAGALRRLRIVGVEELQSVAEYIEQFGKGESACLRLQSIGNGNRNRRDKRQETYSGNCHKVRTQATSQESGLRFRTPVQKSRRWTEWTEYRS